MLDDYWFPHVYIVCSILYYFILFVCERHTNHQSKHIYLDSKSFLAWLDLTCYSSQRSDVVWYLFCSWVDPAMSPGHFMGFVQTFVTPFHPMTSSNCNYQTSHEVGHTMFRYIHISYPAGCCVYMQYVYVYVNQVYSMPDRVFPVVSDRLVVNLLRPTTAAKHVTFYRWAMRLAVSWTCDGPWAVRQWTRWSLGIRTCTWDDEWGLGCCLRPNHSNITLYIIIIVQYIYL